MLGTFSWAHWPFVYLFGGMSVQIHLPYVLFSPICSLRPYCWHEGPECSSGWETTCHPPISLLVTFTEPHCPAAKARNLEISSHPFSMCHLLVCPVGSSFFPLLLLLASCLSFSTQNGNDLVTGLLSYSLPLISLLYCLQQICWLKILPGFPKSCRLMAILLKVTCEALALSLSLVHNFFSTVQDWLNLWMPSVRQGISNSRFLSLPPPSVRPCCIFVITFISQHHVIIVGSCFLGLVCFVFPSLSMFL